jgi:uncharacterized protein DUF2846
VIVAFWPRAGVEGPSAGCKNFTAEPGQRKLSPSSMVEVGALRSRVAAMLIVLLQLPWFEAFAQQTTRPSSQAARLYVYRPNTIIGIGNLDVPFLHLDGKLLTRIRIGGHLSVSVSPGKHKLTTTESLFGSDTGKIRGQAIITVPPGATLYLRYTEGFGTFVPIPLPQGVLVVSSGQFRFEAVARPEALVEISGTQPLELEKGKR